MLPSMRLGRTGWPVGGVNPAADSDRAPDAGPCHAGLTKTIRAATGGTPRALRTALSREAQPGC